MKKILLAVMTMIFSASLFAQETITFNKKEYKLAHAMEFNDDSTWDECTRYRWRTFANQKKEDYFHITRQDTYQEVNKPGFVYIENGALHLKEQHYINEKDQPFAYTSEIYTSPRSWQTKLPKEPYSYQKGYYEIKFKMPKAIGISFAIFLVSVDNSYRALSEANYNKKGYGVSEIDFAELVAYPNQMRPLGGVQFRKAYTDELITGGYKFNEETFLKRIDINEDEWYDQWHTLQVVLEDRKMELYYDGVYFRTVKNPSFLGNIEGGYSFIIRPEYCNYETELDWEDTAVHDFQVDYVRYYKPSK